MVAVITGRIPRYTQSLHRARTVARAPSWCMFVVSVRHTLRNMGSDWVRQAALGGHSTATLVGCAARQSSSRMHMHTTAASHTIHPRPSHEFSNELVVPTKSMAEYYRVPRSSPSRSLGDPLGSLPRTSRHKSGRHGYMGGTCLSVGGNGRPRASPATGGSSPPPDRTGTDRAFA